MRAVGSSQSDFHRHGVQVVDGVRADLATGPSSDWASANPPTIAVNTSSDQRRYDPNPSTVAPV